MENGKWTEKICQLQDFIIFLLFANCPAIKVIYLHH